MACKIPVCYTQGLFQIVKVVCIIYHKDRHYPQPDPVFENLVYVGNKIFHDSYFLLSERNREDSSIILRIVLMSSMDLELFSILKSTLRCKVKKNNCPVQILSLIHISEPTRLGMISYAV